jgi:hypothetical protein
MVREPHHLSAVCILTVVLNLSHINQGINVLSAVNIDALGHDSIKALIKLLKANGERKTFCCVMKDWKFISVTISMLSSELLKVCKMLRLMSNVVARNNKRRVLNGSRKGLH